MKASRRIGNAQALSLQESEALYRTLVERIPVGVVLHRGGPILLANHAAARIAGLSGVEALLGRHLAELLVQDADRGSLRRRFEEVLSGSGEVPPARFRLRAHGGPEVVVEARSVRVALGGETTILTLWHDVTERTLAQERLSASESRFRSLTELSSDWYWEQDAQLRFTRMEGRVLSKQGLDGRAFLGRARWEIGYDNLTAAQWRDHRALLEAHLPFYDFEGVTRDASGRLQRAALVSGEPVFDPGGRFAGYRGVGRDITDRKRAEEALRESQEKLELALSASGLAMFDWNVASDTVELSAEWARIVGGPPGPTCTTGAALRDRLHPAEADALLQRIVAGLKGAEQSYAVEHRVRADDGQWRWIESRAKVTKRSPDGRALRVSGINADVTYRKEVERLKDEFIATVSHELRSPLASLLASLELLREGACGELPEPARRSLELAWQNGERLSALVRDILDLERLEAGTMQLHSEPVRISRFLRRAVSLNEPAAGRYGVHLDVQVPGDELIVEADPDRLLQVVTNLVSNAAKFSAVGARVAVTARSTDGWVRIAVTDSGCGIGADLRNHIFTRFARGPVAQGPRQGGTGLGLAISKGLVERMGGRISFESEVGRGSTFYVDLPPA